jgi:DNA invertase Pin-like site-specific DNA recombinase
VLAPRSPWRHLILLLDELTAVGVGFVSLNEGIDTTTPAGRLQLHVLGAIAEFERERVRERVRAGLACARAHGQRLGRPRVTRLSADAPAGLTIRAAAILWGLSKSTATRRLAGGLLPGGTNRHDPRRLSPSLSAALLKVDHTRDNKLIVPRPPGCASLPAVVRISDPPTNPPPR